MTCITYYKGHIYSDRRVISDSINFTQKVKDRPKYSKHETGVVFATSGEMINYDLDLLIHALILLSVRYEMANENKETYDVIKKLEKKLSLMLHDGFEYLPLFIGGFKEYIFYFDRTQRNFLSRVNQFDIHSVGSDAMNIYLLLKQGMRPEAAYAKVAKMSPFITAEVDKTRLISVKKAKINPCIDLKNIPGD